MKRIFSILFVLVLAVSLMLVPAALVGASPDAGLVGLWHLDGNANDSSGNDNHGTVYGATYVSGKFGQALSFDGNDYVMVHDSLTLEPSNVTVEAWVRKDGSPGTYKYIVAKHYQSGYASYALYTGPSGGLFFYVSDGSFALSNDAGTGVWDGDWHHVVGNYDGSTLRLFVDGSEIGTGKAVSKTIGYDDGNLYIGSYGNGYYFTGMIDEVRIWDEAVNPGPVTVPLYAGQNMDAGTVTVWNDSTDLHVEYQTEGDWCLTETHLHVATSLDAIPQRNGNPVPGQFDYKAEHDCATAYTYTIPLLLSTPLYIAAHAVVVRPIDGCYETVWQIGDVEVVNDTGWLENYADEFNWGYPAGPITMGPSLAVEEPDYTNPFVVGTTPTDEFPFNSNDDRNYATNFDVQWDGSLPFGGMLTISWSPGASATETKEVSGDGITPTTFSATGASKPGEGWFLNTYPLVENSVAVGPLPDGTHSINFNHTEGNGTYWDWVLLEKPCEQEETAWGDGLDFPGKNWATYFMYHVQ